MRTIEWIPGVAAVGGHGVALHRDGAPIAFIEGYHHTWKPGRPVRVRLAVAPGDAEMERMAREAVEAYVFAESPPVRLPHGFVTRANG